MGEHHFLDALRHRGGDIIKMWGLTLDHRAQANQRIVASTCCHFLGKERDVKGAWHLDHHNIFLTYALAAEGIDRSSLQPLGNETVELRNDQTKAHSGRVHL